jgi:biopolymer transport protein ExbB
VKPDKRRNITRLASACLFLVVLLLSNDAFGWWNEEWQYRRKITFDASASGVANAQNLSDIPVLVRLHSGNFNFENAKEEGEDIRFVSSDDATLLKYHIEKFDTIDEMASIWVKISNFSGGAQDYVYMYYGSEEAVGGQGGRETYDASQIAVYHFDELEGMPQDSTGNGNHVGVFLGGQGLPGVVGNSVMLSGGTDRLVVEKTPTLNFSNGMTMSGWVRISGPQDDAYLFSTMDGNRELVVGIDQTRVYAKIVGEDGTIVETDRTAELAQGSWGHVAVTCAPDDTLYVYLDGVEMSSAGYSGSMPEFTGDLFIGGSEDGNHAFAGELDEVQIAGTARSGDWLKAFYASQSANGTLYGVGVEEIGDGGGGLPVFYLGAIMKNITLDGWLVIGCLGILSVASWIVFVTKTIFLYQDEQDNRKFLSEFIDTNDLRGLASEKEDRFPNSALHKVYLLGCGKLTECLTKSDCCGIVAQKDNINCESGKLPTRSLNAVKSVLEKGFIEQGKRLNSYMVILTLAISGGPFLGLLGTVWGVMNTFAAMAEAGEANIMAIAPGVASALSTTVVGLIVAIPALFSYNYLIGKVKGIMADLTIFVDRFGSRIEEFHGD